MELLPSLHKRLKQAAIGRDIPLWRTTQDAVTLYLELASPAGSGLTEHIDEESLERYALGRSLASESEWIEEHLLVCGPCREGLVALDHFILAMRGALAKIGGGVQSDKKIEKRRFIV
ncbi:MAG: hypothetical protein ABSH44_17565 [Bryobacteraceae bacterium]